MSVSDPRQIRALLGAAHGYAVLDRQRRRIGAFAELADDDRIVIRHDGVFVWHRRLLPITTVAGVIPDQRAVVLTVDKRTLVDTETASNRHPEALSWRRKVRGQVAPGKTGSTGT
jgi:hypothetical protein